MRREKPLRGNLAKPNADPAPPRVALGAPKGRGIPAGATVAISTALQREPQAIRRSSRNDSVRISSKTEPGPSMPLMGTPAPSGGRTVGKSPSRHAHTAARFRALANTGQRRPGRPPSNALHESREAFVLERPPVPSGAIRDGNRPNRRGRWQGTFWRQIGGLPLRPAGERYRCVETCWFVRAARLRKQKRPRRTHPMWAPGGISSFARTRVAGENEKGSGVQ